KDDPDRRDAVLHTALQVVQDANTLLTPFLPHAAQKVHEALGGTGVWAAQPRLEDVEDLDIPGRINPILTGDYAAEQARWVSTPVEVGRPRQKPTPIFRKLDPELAETGPEWAPIQKCRAGGKRPRHRSRCRSPRSTPTPTSTPAGAWTRPGSGRPWTGPRPWGSRAPSRWPTTSVLPGGSCRPRTGTTGSRPRSRCTPRARPPSPRTTTPRSSGSPATRASSRWARPAWTTTGTTRRPRRSRSRSGGTSTSPSASASR